MLIGTLRRNETFDSLRPGVIGEGMNKPNWPAIKSDKPALYNFLISKFGTEQEAERDKNLPTVKICSEFYDTMFRD